MFRLGASCPKLIPLLAFLIFSRSLPLAISDDTDTDRQALLCFKSQISDPPGALTSWSNISLNFCNWQGVSCSTQTPLRVQALNLSSQGLSGSIPPCIGNLSSIASLDLSSNSFRGNIPTELGRLSKIRYLNLSINSLDSPVPAELSSCSSLQVLGLWNNSLQGEIPPSLTKCIHLQQVVLNNNKLQGSIPSGFATLHELETLNLANNVITGDIPPLLGSSPSLIYVDFGYIAPEYGMGGAISTKGDVYSYGVLLLEMLTGKRPTDEKFKDSLNLHKLVDTAFPHRVAEILDPTILHNDLDGENSEIMQSCVLPMVKVGLLCSMASARDRSGMAQVSTEILTIKHAFLELCKGGQGV